jgi:hypothetical protein
METSGPRVMVFIEASEDTAFWSLKPNESCDNCHVAPVNILAASQVANRRKNVAYSASRVSLRDLTSPGQTKDKELAWSSYANRSNAVDWLAFRASSGSNWLISAFFKFSLAIFPIHLL